MSASSRSAISFDCRADRDHRRVFRRRELHDRVEMRIILEAVFLHIGHVHGRFRRDQAERLERRLLFVRQIQRAHRLRLIQLRAHLFQHRGVLDGFLVVARLGRLGIACERLFNRGEVGEREFGVDDLDVRQRVDLVRDVNHVLVFEAAHDVRDGVRFADVREELVAEAFALARARHQTGDVDEFHDCRQDALRLDDFRQRFQARVRHFDDPDVRLDRAERIVLGGDARLRQRIEQGGLADVRQADDAAFEAHGKPF